MKRFLFRIAAIIVPIAIIFLIIRTNNGLKGCHYIAHAGGMIDGYTYTNSLEAVNYAISQGIKYIELDLCLTDDGHLVCAHDWNHFRSITNQDTIADIAMSVEEFKRAKIYGKYTPMTIDDILQLWGGG